MTFPVRIQDKHVGAGFRVYCPVHELAPAIDPCLGADVSRVVNQRSLGIVIKKIPTTIRSTGTPSANHAR
jgi:hypothetical protein